MTVRHLGSQDQVGNLAAFLRISDDGSLDYTTYSAQPVSLQSSLRSLAYVYFSIQQIFGVSLSSALSRDSLTVYTAMMYAGGYSGMF